MFIDYYCYPNFQRAVLFNPFMLSYIFYVIALLNHAVSLYYASKGTEHGIQGNGFLPLIIFFIYLVRGYFNKATLADPKKLVYCACIIIPFAAVFLLYLSCRRIYHIDESGNMSNKLMKRIRFRTNIYLLFTFAPILYSLFIVPDINRNTNNGLFTCLMLICATATFVLSSCNFDRIADIVFEKREYNAVNGVATVLSFLGSLSLMFSIIPTFIEMFEEHDTYYWAVIINHDTVLVAERIFTVTFLLVLIIHCIGCKNPFRALFLTIQQNITGWSLILSYSHRAINAVNPFVGTSNSSIYSSDNSDENITGYYGDQNTNFYDGGYDTDSSGNRVEPGAGGTNEIFLHHSH